MTAENDKENANDSRYVLKGSRSQILGQFGEFEVAADWKWNINIGKITLFCILFCLVLLFLLITSLLMISAQSRKMEILQQELKMLKNEVLVQNDNVLKRMAQLREDRTFLSENKRVKREAAGKGNRKHGRGGGGRERKKGKSFRVDNNTPVVKNSSVTAVHFEGSLGYYTSPASGEIRPWIPSKWPEDLLLSKFHLEGQRSKVVVEKSGLYLIYAQMYYNMNNTQCAFEICIKGERVPERYSQVVAECSVGQVVNNMDISCFTSVAQVLQAGDSVFVRQKQKYVNYSMGFGRSFLGLVSLSG